MKRSRTYQAVQRVAYIIKRNLREQKYHYLGPARIRLSPVDDFCNHACSMCEQHGLSTKDQGNPNSTPKRYIQLEEYLQLVKSLPSTVDSVEIVGSGEPLLMKGIERLFAAIDTRIYRSLITNGTLMKPAISRGLAECGWDCVRFSFHAATPQTYAKIHNVDNFPRAADAVRSLLKERGERERPVVAMHFVIQKGNYHEIEDFALLCQEMGVDFISFDSLIANRAGRPLLLNSKEQEKAVALLRSAKQKVNADNNIEFAASLVAKQCDEGWREDRRQYLRDKYCEHILYNLDIGSTGRVVPCCMSFSIANDELNIRHKSIQGIWRAYGGFRKKLRKGIFCDFCYSLCNYEMPERTSIKKDFPRLEKIRGVFGNVR
jgi:MoaA/NifB/PqqE/SkfB family radical SAM enzyme